MGTLAVYPGSFDPFTIGHVDIVNRALKVFDEIIVAVVHNPNKKGLFTAQERVELIKEALKDRPQVKVEFFEGLLIHYAEQKGSRVIVRGLRAVADFEYEFQMALMNKKINPEIETFFLMTGVSFAYISSQIVKEVAMYGGSVKGLVPENVLRELEKKFK